VEKLETLCFAGENVQLCSSCGKIWWFLKELNCDPAVPLLSAYPKELKTMTQADTCSITSKSQKVETIRMSKQMNG
jgi:hypothetical protein